MKIDYDLKIAVSHLRFVLTNYDLCTYFCEKGTFSMDEVTADLGASSACILHHTGLLNKSGFIDIKKTAGPSPRSIYMITERFKLAMRLVEEFADFSYRNGKAKI